MKQAIENLIQYEINQGVIDERDRVYVRNQIYDLVGIVPSDVNLKPIPINFPSDALNIILDDMEKRALLSGTVVERDLFDARIMNIFASLPSQVQYNFDTLYQERKSLATTWYFNYVKSLNYIRYDRILKNESFSVDTDYGKLQITINLSKPEKDPKSIILEGKSVSSEYPKCLLCLENEGFSGNYKRDSRHQHRIIKLSLNREDWYFQYSPYIYYPEHTIVFSASHRPMKIDQTTFKNLLNLVARFPGYFFGSNADLPIVGGSILSHDHYQGGKHEFPIESAKVIKSYQKDDVNLQLLHWPLSTIRLISKTMKPLYGVASKVLSAWRNYANPKLNLQSFTGDTPHHTVTPIARFRNGHYELDLILRDNQTSNEHPLGIFHPHSDKWHIKKENIGLIEAIGLAILPPRLKTELIDLKHHVINQKPLAPESLKHQDWINDLMKKYTFTEDNFDKIMKNEIGVVFTKVLEDCGVFKQNDEGIHAFIAFIEKEIL